MEKKENKSLIIITILAMMFLYAMIAFVTNLAAPVGKIWGADFALNNVNHHELLGMLGNMMNFAAYLIMGIPAGVMLQKIGYKRTTMIAVAVGIVGLLAQYVSGVMESFVVYLVGAFICGFAVCMLNTVVNPLLNLLGGGGNKGNQLNLIGGTIGSLSATLTPMFVGALVGEAVKYNAEGQVIAAAPFSTVNTLFYIAIAVFALVFVIIAWTPIAEPNREAAKIANDGHSAWSFRHLRLGVVAIFLYMGVEIGVPAGIISYLSPIAGFATAGFVAGLYFLLMLVGRFLGSAVGSQVSSRQMVTAMSALAIVLIVAAMALGDSVEVMMISNWSLEMVALPLSAVLLMCVGLCASIMWGCIFNMATEGLGKYTAKASGLFMTMVVGGGILPLIQSGLEKPLGVLGSYIVPLLAVIYILFYALIGSKNVNKDIKVD